MIPTEPPYPASIAHPTPIRLLAGIVVEGNHLISLRMSLDALYRVAHSPFKPETYRTYKSLVEQVFDEVYGGMENFGLSGFHVALTFPGSAL